MKHNLMQRMTNTFRGGNNRRSDVLTQETYELKVHIACDDESGRWYIASSDIPGLRLEDVDPLKLIARIEQAAPELIALNLEEIAKACLTLQPAQRKNAASAPKRAPSILPIFDSPLRLAHV